VYARVAAPLTSSQKHLIGSCEAQGLRKDQAIVMDIQLHQCFTHEHLVESTRLSIIVCEGSVSPTQSMDEGVTVNVDGSAT